MTIKKTLKKDRIDFHKKAKAIFNKYGATESTFYKYEVNTTIGKLFLSTHESDEYGFNFYTMFDDHELAYKHYACNPYSGKYNLHSSNKDHALDWIETLLDEVVKGELVNQN